jgi:carboxymethylenebutenolidase
MLIKESHVDVKTSTTPMRLFIFHPVISSGVKARFPAVAVFTEIYQVTAPITRFCRQIAGHGYIAAACSSYHEFMGPEALGYDDDGMFVTGMGVDW